MAVEVADDGWDNVDEAACWVSPAVSPFITPILRPAEAPPGTTSAARVTSSVRGLSPSLPRRLLAALPIKKSEVGQRTSRVLAAGH